jgi:signal transduction histidine kinase
MPTVLSSLRGRVLRLGLAQRATLMVSAGFAVLFLSISVLGERALQESSTRLRADRLTIAELAADQIDRLLLQAIVELDEIQRSAEFDNPAARAEQARVLSETDRWLSDFPGGIFMLDASGRPLLADPPGREPPAISLSAASAQSTGPLQPIVAQGRGAEASTPAPSGAAAMSGASAPGARVLEPFLDTATSRPMVTVVLPIQRNHEVLGFLAGNVALDAKAVRDTLTEAASLSESGHALLVNTDGRVLEAVPSRPFLSSGEHATFYRSVLAAGAPGEASVPVEGVGGPGAGHVHVMAVAPLSVAPWAVAVGGDEDEILAGVNRLRMGLALVGVVTLITAWLTTMVAARRLVRPVQRLTAAAESIAGGRLDTPLQAPEGGEIGAMAAALESMRQQLLHSITELATWNETLETRVDDRTRALRQQQALTESLLRRVITAQEEERARVSRDLHDGVAQSLTAVQLSIDRAIKSLPAAGAVAASRLRDCGLVVDQALDDLRGMMAALRPGVLDQLGLVAALQWVADHTLRKNGVVVTMEEEGLHGRLPQEIETTLFRIGQEAMSNVARHGEARHLDVTIVHAGDRVRMTLRDDGVGFDEAAVSGAGALSSGLGLAGMRERASAAGGSLHIESAPAKGTEVRIEVPVPPGE